MVGINRVLKLNHDELDAERIGGRHASEQKPVYSDMSNNSAFPWRASILSKLCYHFKSDFAYPRPCRGKGAQISFEEDRILVEPPSDTGAYFPVLFVPFLAISLDHTLPSPINHDNFTTFFTSTSSYMRRGEGEMMRKREALE